MGLFYKELDNELPSQGPLRTALDNGILFQNPESVVHDAVQILTLLLVHIFQELYFFLYLYYLSLSFPLLSY